MSTVGTRLQENRLRKGLTIQEMANAAGISLSAYQLYENNGVKKMKPRYIEAWAKMLGITTDYILYGEKTTSDQINKMPPRIIYVTEEKSKNKIALVPVPAQAGYLQHYQDDKFIRELPLYDLPGFHNGYFRMFPVQGDSMEPTLQEGDILVCEYVEHWADIKDKDIYVVVTTDGICVKRVINQIETKKSLVILSDNEEYNPDVIFADTILEVWKYKRRITV